VSRLMLDQEDEISFLFGPWGAVASATAIEQIRSGGRKYFVRLPDGTKTEIQVIESAGAKRLYARCGWTAANGLDDVPTIGS
jgi:hypothetical protein